MTVTIEKSDDGRRWTFHTEKRFVDATIKELRKKKKIPDHSLFQYLESIPRGKNRAKVVVNFILGLDNFESGSISPTVLEIELKKKEDWERAEKTILRFIRTMMANVPLEMN